MSRCTGGKREQALHNRERFYLASLRIPKDPQCPIWRLATPSLALSSLNFPSRNLTCKTVRVNVYIAGFRGLPTAGRGAPATIHFARVRQPPERGAARMAAVARGPGAGHAGLCAISRQPVFRVRYLAVARLEPRFLTRRRGQ